MSSRSRDRHSTIMLNLATKTIKTAEQDGGGGWLGALPQSQLPSLCGASWHEGREGAVPSCIRHF